MSYCWRSFKIDRLAGGISSEPVFLVAQHEVIAYIAYYGIVHHMKISKLRCEYHRDPLGIDAVQPRLSWIVESDQRGQRQTAYQVIVADSLDELDHDNGNLWDSAKVDSDRTCQIVYAGRPLTSRMMCYWKVRSLGQSRRGLCLE